ncbi:ribonuclease H-like protein [Xylaria digitata]|nr:ribonuclease H-like protein [Xylaria digitata]
MTATPPRNNRLWHPSRGILFSPGPAPLASPAWNPRSMTEVPVGSSQYHVATSQSVGTRSEAWDATIAQQETPAQQPQSLALNLPLRNARKQVDLYESVQITEAKEAESDAEAEKSTRKVTDDPPPAVSEYKMVDTMFYAAKNSPLGSPGSYWSYEQYRRTAEDGSSHKVRVHYCRSRHTMERVCKEYFMDEKILGFDLEWMVDATRRDGPKRNVSLIQLASPSRIGLFHVALFADSDDMVGPSFRSLMENPDVIKVGVSIKGDTTRLRTFLDVDSRGLMELSHLYRLVTYSRNGQYHNINRKLVPLATQVQDFLHLPMFKGADVRSGNWSRPLDVNQVAYSASDAYAGLQLYKTLQHHRRQLDPCPPSPHLAELNLRIRLADGVKVTRPDNTPKASDVVALETTSLNVEETTSLITVSTKTNTSIVSKKKPAPKSPERPKDSRIEVAEDRVASYRSSHPGARATFVQLRAYFLWHCFDLSPASIAELLRDPPLQLKTVVGYILAAVQSEKLPVDRERLREVADSIPLSTLRNRWPVVRGMLLPTGF